MLMGRIGARASHPHRRCPTACVIDGLGAAACGMLLLVPCGASAADPTRPHDELAGIQGVNERKPPPSPVPPAMVETALLEWIEELPLRVFAAPIVDHCRQPTALDEADFQDINAIVSTLEPIDQQDGWSCVARTGGRPFRCIDRIDVNGEPF